MAAAIVRAGPAEIPLFDKVAPDVFDGPIDRALLDAYVAAPGHLMVIAVEAGVVVGQARGVIHRHPDRADELYVDNLGVGPAAQRRGIGRRLMDELIAWAKVRGAESAWVATEPDNGPANALDRKLGAEPVAMTYFEYDLD